MAKPTKKGSQLSPVGHLTSKVFGADIVLFTSVFARVFFMADFLDESTPDRLWFRLSSEIHPSAEINSAPHLPQYSS